MKYLLLIMLVACNSKPTYTYIISGKDTVKVKGGEISFGSTTDAIWFMPHGDTQTVAIRKKWQYTTIIGIKGDTVFMREPIYLDTLTFPPFKIDTIK